MARPTKLSPELTERLALLIRAGNTIEVAAQASGIDPSTFRSWMNRPEPRFVTFQGEIEKARSEAEATQVVRISQAASKGSWQAAAWLLERRYAERWSKKGVKAEPEKKPKTQADELAELRAQKAAEIGGS